MQLVLKSCTLIINQTSISIFDDYQFRMIVKQIILFSKLLTKIDWSMTPTMKENLTILNIKLCQFMQKISSCT